MVRSRKALLGFAALAGAASLVLAGCAGGTEATPDDSAEPVTDDYEGESPWPFVGGAIARAVVDVSGPIELNDPATYSQTESA